MNKNILIGIGLLVVVAVGAYFLGLRNQDNEVAQETPTLTPTAFPESPTPTPEPTATSSPPPPKPVAKPVVKEFTIVAKQYTFEPNTITVNKGDRVKLYVKSVDVTHGISIPDFGVSEIIRIEAPKTIEFVASKAGTYGMFCSEYCGAGHPNMKGFLVVQ